MKLSAHHINFIISKIAVFQNNRSELVRLLANPDIAKEFNFDPIEVSRQTIEYHISKDEIQEMILIEQVKYLSNYTEIELAHRKNRIRELVKMYQSIDHKIEKDGKEEFYFKPKTRFDMKLSVLRQLKEEKGEDTERLAEALEKGTIVNLTVSDILLSRYEKPSDETRITENQNTIQ